MDVKEALCLIDENRTVLDLYYWGESCFEAHLDGGEVSLFIYTKADSADVDRLVAVQDVFGAVSANYVPAEEEHPAFWSVVL